MSVEIALFLNDKFNVACRQADQIEPKSGVERIGQSIELFAEQPCDRALSWHL